jgi:hypothetical protein
VLHPPSEFDHHRIRLPPSITTPTFLQNRKEHPWCW